MDDLASKLNEILGNPESMEKIQNRAGMLGQSGGGLGNLLGNLGNPAPPAASALPPAPANTAPGVDGELLQTVMKIAPLLSTIRQEDKNTRLLRALRPMLGQERQRKLDEAEKMLQMLRILPLLKGTGIF